MDRVLSVRAASRAMGWSERRERELGSPCRVEICPCGRYLRDSVHAAVTMAVLRLCLAVTAVRGYAPLGSRRGPRPLQMSTVERPPTETIAPARKLSVSAPPPVLSDARDMVDAFEADEASVAPEDGKIAEKDSTKEPSRGGERAAGARVGGVAASHRLIRANAAAGFVFDLTRVRAQARRRSRPWATRRTR